MNRERWLSETNHVNDNIPELRLTCKGEPRGPLDPASIDLEETRDAHSLVWRARDRERWGRRLEGKRIVSPFDPRAVGLLPDHRRIDLSASRPV